MCQWTLVRVSQHASTQAGCPCPENLADTWKAHVWTRAHLVPRDPAKGQAWPGQRLGISSQPCCGGEGSVPSALDSSTSLAAITGRKHLGSSREGEGGVHTSPTPPVSGRAPWHSPQHLVGQRGEVDPCPGAA